MDFFLLQDLVTEDYSAVRFFMPCEGFTRSPLPGSVDAYNAYMQLAIEFIEARNRRIDAAQPLGAPRSFRSMDERAD